MGLPEVIVVLATRKGEKKLHYQIQPFHPQPQGKSECWKLFLDFYVFKGTLKTFTDRKDSVNKVP